MFDMPLSAKAFPPEYIESTTCKEAARNTGEEKISNSFCFLYTTPTKKNSLINHNYLAQYMNIFI